MNLLTVILRQYLDRNKILIFTEFDADPHAVVVKKKLQRMGESVVVIDPGKLPTTSKLTHEIRNVSSSKSLVLATKRISLDNVKSCWVRRPSTIELLPNIHPDYREIIQSEWRMFLNALWQSMESCLWVSNPAAIRQAELKSIQLSIARKLGLDIPRTIITNDIDRAYEFYIDSQRKMIVKKIYSHAVSHGEKSALFVTHLMTNLSKRKLDNLIVAPCIFQEYVEKRIELRVTVIGEDIFGVSIDSQAGKNTKIDWRAGKEEGLHLKHSIYELPSDISEKCKKLVKEFGLRFGTIDMILTPHDNYVFLELNPNGQWLWLELMTKVPMADSMARLLANC